MSSENSGTAFTKHGPGSYISPKDGGILSNPELLWIDDEWTEERTAEAQQALLEQKSNGAAPNDFWINKYKTSGAKYWHEFYKRNKTNFYKDRHYLQVVFPELDIKDEANSECTNNGNRNPLKLMEVGCGVGNAVLPLLEVNPLLQIVAIDFAKSAIELLNSEISGNSKYNIISPDRMDTDGNANGCDGDKRIAAHVCDITKDALPVLDNSMDLILCMFVVSAIAPELMESAFRKLYQALKPGGKLLFRDYGRFDEAQMRFTNKSRLEDNFYVRQDGTCAYYFEDKELVRLLCGPNHSIPCKPTSSLVNTSENNNKCDSVALDSVFNSVMNFDVDNSCGVSSNYGAAESGRGVGFECEECYYIHRQYANRNQKKVRYRVWLHGKFVKPKG